MCGIAGIYHARADRAVDPDLLTRMNDAISHRGPDGDGTYLTDGIGLAHRRLAIIDREGGHQPLFNEDGSVAVTYNGEIYNFHELFEELRARGHVFRTHCDTEAIVHAWEEWGEECVTRFRGMFAFVIWDSRTQTLFLARDRLGIKPLHYAVLDDGSIVFGSELKAVLAHPHVDRALDLHAIEDYFGLGYVPDPKTVYTSVRKLAPAHTLCVRRGQPVPAPREYWDVTFAETSKLSEADAAVELVERLREAVRIRLVSEVPLGAFLSGGVDSSAVVALMAQESGRAMDTCSIGFDDAAYDESAYARQVSDRYKTRHASETMSANAVDLVDRLGGMFDEPFADSSAMPTFRVSELAKRRVTVALSGDGGDELFAGYRRYRFHGYEESARRMLPTPLRRPLFGMLGRAYPKLDWAPRALRAKTTFQSIARDSVEGYFHGVSVISDEMRQSIYSASMRRGLGGYQAIEVFRKHLDKAPTHDPVALAQYIDLKTWLPGDILTKVDRTSMAVALEVRVPMLDHHFVEWSATLPRSLRLRGNSGKVVLKKAFEPLLSKDLLYRQKMGFSVPLASWFRGQLATRVRETVLGQRMMDTGLFDQATLKRLLDEHQSGHGDHSRVLWSLMMFDSFLCQDGVSSQAILPSRVVTLQKTSSAPAAAPSMRARLAAPALIALGLLFGAHAASAEDLPKTIQMMKPTIVAVGSYKKDRAPSAVIDATGFVVGNGLTVVTSAHVLARKIVDGERWTVFSGHGDDAMARSADVLCTDNEHDIATLRVATPQLPAVKLATTDNELDGQSIAFTGYPLGATQGLYASTARGIISALVPAAIPQNRSTALNAETIHRLRQNFSVYQLDAIAYPGNSGSPVYRSDSGVVIGIIDSVYVKPTRESALESVIGSPSGITYAIPARFIRELLAKSGCSQA